ncbi:MAG: hypothetical protein LBL07_19625 [Tannerella sp.]|jgi:hypothetical protein|nr:hypothetical protein [Tannerella sp.]
MQTNRMIYDTGFRPLLSALERADTFLLVNSKTRGGETAGGDVQTYRDLTGHRLLCGHSIIINNLQTTFKLNRYDNN